MFHHSVSQLPFMISQFRRDIKMVVSFLTTKVKIPYEDDWGKLKMVLKYPKGTKHMKLTLILDSLSIVYWWIDELYNTHENCRGHIGCMMILGKGEVLSSSLKQTLSVKSFIEGKLLGAHYGLSVVLQSKNFIKSQDHTMEHNKLY